MLSEETMINFVLGRAGTGKTTQLLTQMRTLEQQGESVVFLVPEQYTLQAERDLLQTTKATAIQVLSFGRLAYRVFAETGIADKTILDEVSMAMLLRKVVRDVADQLVYYKETTLSPGFIAKLSVTIAQIEAGYLSEAVLHHMADRSSAVAEKTADIFTIYRQFLTYTGAQYISTEQALSVLTGQIAKSQLIANAHVFIDGFSSFSVHEHHVLAQMVATAKSSTIALTLSEAAAGTPQLHETDVFFETKGTYDKLRAAAGRAQLAVSQQILTTNQRHAPVSELAVLEQHLFDFSHRYETDTTQVTLTPYENIYQEVSGVASHLLSTLAQGNYRYADIAVMAPENYRTPLKTIFADHQIPIFMDETRGIASHPLINTLVSAVEAVVHNWSSAAIFACLKAGLTGIERRDIDVLENYVIAHGINHYQWQFAHWRYPVPWLSNTEELQAELDMLNRIRDQVVSVIAAVEAALGGPTLKAMVMSLYRVLSETGMLAHFEQNIHSLTDEHAKQEDVLIYNKLMDLLDTMTRFLADVPMTPQDFLVILQAGIEAITPGKVPENIDSVIVASQGRSRLPDIQVLFVLGTANQVGADNSLYTESQKLTLAAFDCHLPLSSDKVFENNFSVYSYFTKPSACLHMSYALADLNGGAFGLSPLVSILKNKGISPHAATKRYTPQTSERAKRLHTYEQLRNQGELPLTPIQGLSQESLNKLYDVRIQTSITQLERYARCPFSYFLKDNLKTKERKIYELSHIDYGNVFHDWLEAFMLHADKHQLNLAMVTREDIRLFLQGLAQVLVTDHRYQHPRNQQVLAKLLDMGVTSIWAMCQQTAAGDFTFHDAEMHFGRDQVLDSIVIDINGVNHFLITGKIDRVDMLYTDPEGNSHAYIKIMDYKSGKQDTIKPETVAKGLQLQLLTYMQAVLEKGEVFGVEGELLPGGLLYFKLDNPWLKGDQEEALVQELLKAFTMTGLVLDEPPVIEAFEKRGAGVIPSSRSESSRLDRETFTAYMHTATDTIKQIGQHMLDGYIAPTPFKEGTQTGCDHCHYRPVCQFDEKSGHYNVMDMLKKVPH